MNLTSCTEFNHSLRIANSYPLTSQHVYKSALTVPEALAMMAKPRGLYFDPVLLDRFIGLAPTTALATLLQQRLLPYLDFFTRMEPLLAEAREDFVAPSSAVRLLNRNPQEEK